MERITGDNQEDKELVARVIRGDKHAFAIIIRNTEKLVTSIVSRMILNTEDRKDVAQDIYLKAFRKLGSFRFEAKLSTWIGHIAYTSCLDQLKKRQLALILDKDDQEERKVHDEMIVEDNSLLTKDLGKLLQKGIEQLPPLYRTLVTLYHTDDLSYDEIMRITDLPEGTVKNYLFRSRKMLRTILLEQYKKEDL